MLTVLEADRWVNILSRIAINVFGEQHQYLIERYIQQLPNLVNAVNYYLQQVNHPEEIETIFVKHARNIALQSLWNEILDLRVMPLIVNENPTQLRNLIRASMVGKLQNEPSQYGTTQDDIDTFHDDYPQYRQWEGLLKALAPIYREVEVHAFAIWQQDQQVIAQQQQINMENGRRSRATTPRMVID